MQRDRSAEGILKYLIDILEEDLEELNTLEVVDDFSNGEKHACVECLEVIREWEKAEDYGLDYDIEERFPL